MLATGYSVRCIQSSDASKRRPESFPCELAALRREIACLKQEMSALVNRLEPVTMVQVGICSMQDASDINSFIRDKFVAGSMGVSKTPLGQSPAGSEFACAEGAHVSCNLGVGSANAAPIVILNSEGKESSYSENNAPEGKEAGSVSNNDDENQPMIGAAHALGMSTPREKVCDFEQSQAGSPKRALRQLVEKRDVSSDDPLQSQAESMECMHFDISSDAGADEALIPTEIDVNMLSNMADSCAEGGLEDALILIIDPRKEPLPLPEGESFTMARSRKRQFEMVDTSAVMSVWKAAAAIGQKGTISSLHSEGLLTVGTILESAIFEDTVYMRGFNGIRYDSATPVIRIKEVDNERVTVCDASVEPTRDRGGRIAFGLVDRDHESFVIIGHSRWLDGVVTSFNELFE